MKDKSNFHSHCTFCDGRSKAENFLKDAINADFRAYGFSSHSPLPFQTVWNMSAKNMPAYLDEINRLKSIYSADIEIYTGLEIDYLDETYNASIPYFRELPLDYRIGSIHFIPWQFPHSEENMICIDGSYDAFESSVNRHYCGDIKRAVKKYFENSMKMVEAGNFDIVGHIDKIYMNASRHKDFNIEADWYQKLFLELLDFISEKRLIVEINTKNKIRKNQTYPHLHSYKELHNRKIPVIISSDAHYTNLIYSGIAETKSALKKIGYRYTCELVRGRWDEVGID